MTISLTNEYSVVTNDPIQEINEEAIQILSNRKAKK